MSSKPRIAVIGGGIGGTTAAILLQRAGYPCKVYEQAPAFVGAGAGIQIAPNSTRILRKFGLGESMARAGIQPEFKLSREWNTGRQLFAIPIVELSKRYNGPFYAFHRGDLQDMLTSLLEPGTIVFGKRLVGLQTRGAATTLSFADGSTAEADAVVGADGVHSKVREILLGAKPPSYHGLVAYRCMFPTSELGDMAVEENTKWWAPDRYLLHYFFRKDRQHVYFVTGSPEDWQADDFAPQAAPVEAMRAVFEGFHPTVQRLVQAASSATKWAMLEREPFRPWSDGSIVLIGDACHPTTPHMGQGAGMAIEDAVVLVRCMESADGSNLEKAFQLYEDARFDRTARIQNESHRNEWGKSGIDHQWVYGYDALTVPLGADAVQIPPPQPMRQHG
jgi:6-hydroxynicotinate 3-monooxygenase